MNKVYRNNAVEGLKDLASYDFQKAAWFDNDLGLWSSFEEDVDAVFLESGLEYSLKQNEIVFGLKADEALRDLRTACTKVPTHRDDKFFIESKEMQDIREMAKTCLRLIKEYSGGESTVELVDSEMVRLSYPFADRDKL